MKKYLILLALLLGSIIFVSCGNSENISSDDISAEISDIASKEDESKFIVSGEEATAMLEELLKKDKKNVELFFDNGLYELSQKSGTTAPIDKNSEFGDFSNVEKLFDIYTFPTNVKEYFFSFPLYGEKAVFEKNGVVYATKINSTSLSYPIITDFSMLELSLDSATFSFETKNGTKKITVDFATKTISDSPYRLMTESDYSDKWLAPSFEPSVVNNGSGKKLLGKTLIINVFVSDKNSEWDSDSVKKTLEKIEKGVKWLQTNAENNNVDLELSSTTSTTSLFYRSSSKLTNEAEDQIWINEMFSHTIYGSVDEYINSNCNVKNYDNYVVLFHLNKDGENNYGRYDSELFEKDLYKTERAVMYKGSSEKDYVRAVLYLFGAQSYGEHETEAKTYFGNEIMLENSVFNDSLKLGEITSYLIGWTKSVHPQLAIMVREIFK